MDAHHGRLPNPKAAVDPSVQQQQPQQQQQQQQPAAAANAPLTNTTHEAPMHHSGGPSNSNLLHSTNFVEWVARADAQNQRLGIGSSARSDTGSASRLDAAKSSTVSSPGGVVAPKRRRRRDNSLLDSFDELDDDDKADRFGDEEPDIDEDDALSRCNAPDNFIAHFKNYASMDLELNIIREHLRKNAGY